MAFSLQGFIDNSLPTIKAAWLNAVDKMYALGQRTNAGTPITLANSQWQVTDSTNNYSSMDINNQSNGILASSDFVMTADTGTDTTNYVNIGINCSGYSQAGWTVNGALDGYVYASNGNLAIGTASAKRVDFFVGGTLSANVAMTISSAGTVSLTTSPSSSDNTTKVATTAMVQAAIAAGGSAGRLLNTINFTAQTQALTSISNAAPAVFTNTSALHLPETGSPVQFTTSGTLPTGLALATTYYVTNPSGSTYNVCNTLADAIAGTNKVATSGAGSGTHTQNSIYVKNASSSFIIVEVQGAGGGGGGTTAATNGGGGGAAGNFSSKKIAAASLSSTTTITIGAGGTGGTNAPTDGGTGGTTSFGAFCSSTGGAGGKQGASAGTTAVAGGSTGTPGTSGDFNFGGAAGSSASGTGTTAGQTSGAGGISRYGGNGQALSGAAGTAGNNALNNSGSGGSGAPVNGNTAGGVAGSGRCVVYEYS